MTTVLWSLSTEKLDVKGQLPKKATRWTVRIWYEAGEAREKLSIKPQSPLLMRDLIPLVKEHMKPFQEAHGEIKRCRFEAICR